MSNKSKKYTIITITLIMIISIMLSSCSTLGSSRNQNSFVQDYRTGNQGLVLNFVKNSPPQRVYNGDSLTLTAEYVNKGAYDIIGGYFYLTGFDENIIYLDRVSANFAATGKSTYNPEGVLVETTAFSTPRIVLPQEFTDSTFKQTFLLTACYDYQTHASPLVCIDPDPYTTNSVEKACTPSSISLGGGQGAPVAVTLIEQESSRNKVLFKVHVANVGGSDVIDPSMSVANCHRDLKMVDLDKVAIRAEFSNRQLICEPQLIRLNGGRGFAYCSTTTEDFRQLSAYNTILNIYLDYGYRTSVGTSVDIINR